MTARRDGLAGLARNAWWILALALVAQIGFSVIEMGVPLIAGFMKDDLGLSAAAAGTVVTAHYVGKMIGSYPSGVVVDRIGERRILVAGGALVAVSLGLATLVPYPAVLVPLFFSGLFSSVCVPAGGSLIRHIFPAARRGLALSVRQSGIPLGGLVGALLLPPVADAYGWQWALAVAGVLAFAGSLPLLTTRPPNVGSVARAAQGAGSDDDLRGLRWLTRDVVLLTVYSCILVMGQFGLLLFIPLDLQQREGLSLATGAILVAVVQLAGGAGRMLWGVASDRRVGHGRRSVLVVLTLASFVAMALLAALPDGSSLAVWAVVAALAGLTLNSFQGIWITMLSEASDIRSVGRATGFAIMFNLVAVAVCSPALGAVADAAGTYRAVWVVLSVVVLTALVPLVWVGRTAAAGVVPAGGYVRRVEAVEGEGTAP